MAFLYLSEVSVLKFRLYDNLKSICPFLKVCQTVLPTLPHTLAMSYHYNISISSVVGQNVTISLFNQKYNGLVHLHFHFVTHYINNYNHKLTTNNKNYK